MLVLISYRSCRTSYSFAARVIVSAALVFDLACFCLLDCLCDHAFVQFWAFWVGLSFGLSRARNCKDVAVVCLLVCFQVLWTAGAFG